MNVGAITLRPGTPLRLSAMALALGVAAAPACAQRAPDAPPLHDGSIHGSTDCAGAGLVDVLDGDSTFVLDVRYATERNFTGEILYPVARCLLRPNVAERLVRVHERLRRENLRLRIFDCYRPLSIQRRLWELVPDERYVANPAKGSRHNRGAAVDLTLADSSGAALPMPTEYDDFTPRAHRDYQAGDPQTLANRGRLAEAMTVEGFEGLPTEWWHFDAPGWKEHAILDVPLDSGSP